MIRRTNCSNQQIAELIIKAQQLVPAVDPEVSQINMLLAIYSRVILLKSLTFTVAIGTLNFKFLSNSCD